MAFSEVAKRRTKERREQHLKQSGYLSPKQRKTYPVGNINIVY